MGGAFGVWGGLLYRVDGIFGIVDSEFIFLMLFHFKRWVFGDWDDVISILDGHYTFWDDYLVFKMINPMFLLCIWYFRQDY